MTKPPELNVVPLRKADASLPDHLKQLAETAKMTSYVLIGTTEDEAVVFSTSEVNDIPTTLWMLKVAEQYLFHGELPRGS